MKIQKKCPCCGKLQTLEVNENEYQEWLAGKSVQKAFPNLNEDQREILMSGICPECWDTIFPEEEEEDDSEYNEFGIDSRTGDPFHNTEYS